MLWNFISGNLNIIKGMKNKPNLLTQNIRDLSLVEQKRIQWAKEKDEMLRLAGGGSELFSETTKHSEKTCIRTYYSNWDLPSTQNSYKDAYNYPRQNTTAGICSDHFNYTSKYPPSLQNQQSLNDNHSNGGSDVYMLNERRLRSPSLPPIKREKFVLFRFDYIVGD